MIKLLSCLGFLGSWYVSFLLASTLATTKTDYVVAFIFTSVMQYASFYFFKIRHQNKNYSCGIWKIKKRIINYLNFFSSNIQI